MDVTAMVCEHCGKLAPLERAVAHLYDDVDCVAKAARRTIARAQQGDSQAKLVASNANGLDEIGVVRQNDRHLAVLTEDIDEQARRQVDIRALLLRDSDADVLLAHRAAGSVGTRLDTTHPTRSIAELAKDDLDVTRRQCAQIHLLTRGFLRIVCTSDHASGEVLHPLDYVEGKQRLGERPKIQPLTVRKATPQGAVIEVEPVDVDIGLHARDPSIEAAI